LVGLPRDCCEADHPESTRWLAWDTLHDVIGRLENFPLTVNELKDTRERSTTNAINDVSLSQIRNSDSVYTDEAFVY
ncbi:unnamed protein product, partial [Trichobilharzia szidati]